MGFFDRIKQLFSPKEKTSETESVSSSELDAWLDNKILLITEAKNKDMKILCYGIKEHIEEAKEKLNVLQDAKLMNDKIPDRAKQILSGNKEEYMKKMKQFLEHIKPSEDSEVGREKISKYCEDFRTAAEYLQKNSIKQSFVLREFHENEVRQITTEVKAIEDNVSKLNEIIKDEQFENIDKVRNSIGKLNAMVRNIELIKTQFNEQEKEISECRESLRKTEEEIVKITKSPDFIDMQKDKQKKEKMVEGNDYITLLLNDKFSNLRKALEKFKRGRMEEKLIDKYLQDPVHALVEDKKLDIIPILDSLKRSIDNNQIDVKDNIRKKTLEVCYNTTRDELKEYARKYDESRKEVEAIEKRIKESTILKVKGDLDNKHDFLNEKITKLEDANRLLKEKRRDSKLEDAKADIKENVKELLDIELEFKD